MKIHYFSAEPWEKTYVQAKLAEQEVIFHDGSVQENAALADPEAEALCIFIDSKIGEPELARFPQLKLIATRSTGYDHIDLTAAQAGGITVVTVPSYGENTVAEFAFALILALSRRLIEANESVRRSGTFVKDGLRGFDLAGKTLGVVGCGHIGVHAIAMGNGFNMRVLGFDTHQDETFAQAHNFTYASLEELLAQADIITLHVPYNTHTHHLIHRDSFRIMKKGALLINTARGAVVETEALVEALKDGTLAGAGLDVLEEEGVMNESDELALLTTEHPNAAAIQVALADRYLMDHPRVIITPHVGFDTTEAVLRITDTTLESLRHFANGTLPEEVVVGTRMG